MRVPSIRRTFFPALTVFHTTSYNAYTKMSLHRAFSVPTAITPKVLNLYRESDAPKVVSVSTGGGSQLCGWLVGTPGASVSVLEMNVPYLQSSLADYLGYSPKRYCCEATARDMSEKALVRSKELWLAQHQGQFKSLLNQRFVGISSTSSLVTNRPKKGEHKSYISLSTDKGVKTFSVVLSKEVGRSRDNEDDLVSRLMLKAVLESKQCFPTSSTPSQEEEELASHNVFDEMTRLYMEAGDEMVEKITLRPEALDQFLESIEENALIKSNSPSLEKQDNVLFIPYSMSSTDQKFEKSDSLSSSFLAYPNFKPKATRVIVYPGSFNPLHEGHIALAETVREMLREKNDSDSEPLPFVYEIAVKNADKPSIPKEEIVKRIQQFHNVATPVVITKAALFSEKARVLPGSMFVIGADTAKRILDPKYYNNSVQEMIIALTEIKELNCQFMVAGRKSGDAFLTLPNILSQIKTNEEGGKQVSLPSGLISGLFVEIPQEKFRVDLSSTEIRNKAKQA